MKPVVSVARAVSRPTSANQTVCRTKFAATSASTLSPKRSLFRQLLAVNSGSTAPSLRRQASTASPAAQKRSLSYLVMFLVGATASYGLYIAYQSWATWPAPLRSLLRQALRKQRQGRLEEAEQLFREALEVSKRQDLQASLDIFKTSGIAISLGGVLEQQKKPRDALKVYDAAFTHISKAMDTAKRDRALMMRGVALAQKVGQLASDLPGESYEKLAEKRMSWAVTKLLKVVAQHQQDDSRDIKAGLDLPDFVTKTDLGASMEDLGMFYLNKGDKEFATPLLFRALTVLLPSGMKPGAPGAPTLSERCHAATIANNLSSAFALAPAEPDQASIWAENASFISDKAIAEGQEKNQTDQIAECLACKAIAHVNRGDLRRSEGKIRLATNDFQEALRVSREHQLVESAKEARAGLEKISQR